MKFGFNQIGKETPDTIRGIKRALNFFIAGIVTFFPFVSKVTGIAIDDLSQIVGLFALFVNSFGVMFGINTDANKLTEEEGAEQNDVKMRKRDVAEDGSNPDKPRGGG